MSSQKEIGVKKDCFAYKEKDYAGKIQSTCIALKELYCQKEQCKFYKRREEILNDWHSSYARDMRDRAGGDGGVDVLDGKEE